MRQRLGLWVALVAFAGLMTGLVVVGVGSGGGRGRGHGPAQLPTLALGSGGADSRALGAAAFPMPLNVTYQVRGALPELRDHARAYSFGSTYSARLVGLARALGLNGAVQTTSSGWIIVGGDRSLRVDQLPGTPWTYSTSPPCAVLGSGATGSAAPVSPQPAQPQTPRPAPQPAPQPAPPGPTPPTAVALGPSVVASGCVGTAASGSGAISGVSTGGAPGGPTAVAGCPPPCPPAQACPNHCIVPTPVTLQPRADLPSRAAAEQLARDLLARAGMNLDGATVTVDNGYTEWLVSVDPSIDGVPIVGFSSTVTIGPKGLVQLARGFLGSFSSLGDYPLVGVEGGLQRLREGRLVGPESGLFGGPVPLAAAAGAGARPAVAASTSSATPPVPAQTPPVPAQTPPVPAQTPPVPVVPPVVPPCPSGATCAVPRCLAAVPCPVPVPQPLPCPPATQAACQPVTPPTIVRTITGVRLGLLAAPAAAVGATRTGQLLFVPAYVFELDGGGSVAVVAVQDRFLSPDQQPTTTPRPPPPSATPVVLTEKERGATVTVPVGALIEVALSAAPAHDSPHADENSQILTLVSQTDDGTRTVYRAAQPGRADLASVDLPCGRHPQGACPAAAAALYWSATIVVTAG